MGTGRPSKIEQTVSSFFFPFFQWFLAAEEWFKANYRDCVEGLLSMVLYLSLIMDERRATWYLITSTRAMFHLWKTHYSMVSRSHLCIFLIIIIN